ncbi:hypothetical protein C1H46_014434 [Malus baccata]|uniref:Uncharacterized protein n=1 Tax=Malus baccata TaxID=106549 RepID=A0A540MMB7_MALBA|nr:hypothetical protein C1H46_014434 [Malus baccata]
MAWGGKVSVERMRESEGERDRVYTERKKGERREEREWVGGPKRKVGPTWHTKQDPKLNISKYLPTKVKLQNCPSVP